MVVNEIYHFRKSETNKQKYLLESCTGAGLIPLPIEKKSGRSYIEFMENLKPSKRGASRSFSHGFYLGYVNGKHKRLTGVNLPLSKKCVCAGDTLSLGRNDALIFDFHNTELTMYVAYGQAANIPLLLTEYKSSESLFCAKESVEI